MHDTREFTRALGAIALAAALAAPSHAPAAGTGSSQSPHQATFWRDGDPGERLVLRGMVLDADRQPVAGAAVTAWQADGAGSYHDDAYRGTMITDDAGRFVLRTALPGNYATARHIHMSVSHEAHPSVWTEVNFKGDPRLGYETPTAILLEETRVSGEVVWVGTFNVVLE